MQVSLISTIYVHINCKNQVFWITGNPERNDGKFDPTCCGSWRQSNQTKCGKDQGGCDNDEDCSDELICGLAGNCPEGFPNDARCCSDDNTTTFSSSTSSTPSTTSSTYLIDGLIFLVFYFLAVMLRF